MSADEETGMILTGIEDFNERLSSDIRSYGYQLYDVLISAW